MKNLNNHGNARPRLCRSFHRLALVGAGLFLAAAAQGSVFVSINTLGYTGSWEKFNTLADAQNNTNPILSGTVPQRDLGIEISQGRATPDVFFIGTLFDLPGTPSNDKEGFVQVDDPGLNTVDSLSAGWTDTNFDTYTVNLTGSNALPRMSLTVGNNEARLGVGPDNSNSPNRSSSGIWHSYELNLTFSGLTSSEVSSGIQGANDEPLSVLGNVFVIFENPFVQIGPQPGFPNQNLGFYRVNLTINEVSWAVANSAFDSNTPQANLFEASTTPVPEPGAFALILSLLAGFWVVALRRNRA